MITKHCRAIGAAKAFDANQEQRPLFRKAPEYPLQARRAGKEGEVVLRYTLDDQGFVEDPAVLDVKGGNIFSRAAIKALKQWRFAPRFIDGKPVATPELKHRITFELL